MNIGKPAVAAIGRRTIIKTAAAAGIVQLASPFIIAARGATPIKIGMIDPLTGVYAAVAHNEVMGAKLAVDEINAKGGVLGRRSNCWSRIRPTMSAPACRRRAS